MGTENLKDEDLIQEKFSRNPRPFFTWLIILVILFLAIIGIQWGLKELLQEKLCESPFHRVTNREFSLFLWQNPEFMRAHVKKKSGYLPDFQYLNKVSVEPTHGDDFVSAPPKILFLYHTWNRQIGDLYIPRPISPKEFGEFLEYAEEWKPKYWDDAPKDYVKLVNHLSTATGDLNDRLPLQAKQAFEGWKNYTQEGEVIQDIRPTYAEMRAFIKKYPIYARNYWKNLVSLDYLKSLPDGKPEDQMPKNELAAFLKVALYNYQMASQGR